MTELVEEAIRQGAVGLSSGLIYEPDSYRGTLAAGRKADIVVFDSASISDRATFEAPHQLSTGVRWLIVNGQVVIDDGRHTGAMPGRILRHTPRAPR